MLKHKTTKYDLWVMYQNACRLCVTNEGRNNPKLSKKRNKIADDLYQQIKDFTTEDRTPGRDDL